jgi:hypothetical protein
MAFARPTRTRVVVVEVPRTSARSAIRVGTPAMITPSTEKSSRYIAICDRCRESKVTLEVTTHGDARAELRRLEWLECARPEKGVKGARWWCPSCNPELRPAPTTTRTTPTGSISVGRPYGHCATCGAKIVCAICESCADHCHTAGGPDECWREHERWRRSLLSSDAIPEAPRPRWERSSAR